MRKLSSLLPSISDIKIVSQNENVRQKSSLKTIDNISFVVKGNALIEARYRLSLQESHIILWLLTQIRSDDEDFKLHRLNISEFANMVGLKSDGQYTELQTITESLMRRILKIREPETHSIIQVAWLSFVKYEKKKGCVLLRFDPGLKPYLLQLQSHFTKINITDSLRLKSIHAVRIFELLLQYAPMTQRTICVDDLRLYCGIESHEYTGYGMFKRKVIEKAKTEINSKTEYNVDYTEIKESRKVVAIEWTIKKKNLEKEKHTRRIKTLEKELHSELILIASMIDYGYSKMMAKRLIKEYGEERVKHILQAVTVQVKKGNAKNPKAMIYSGIVGEWKPDVYTVKKK